MNPFVRLPLCVSGLVTVTVTAPAACAAVVAVMVVLLTTTTFVAAVPPSVAVAPLTKFVPLIVIDVPPAAGPLFGFTPVTVGAGPRYVYPFVKLPLCVSGLVTVTVTAPAACAAVVAVMVVLLTTTTFVAAVPPSVAVAPLTKFVPLIVIDVPPTAGPLFGFTPVTVGADPRYVYPFVKLPLCVSGLVTVTVTTPAACAAVVAVMVVLLTTTTFVAAVPPSVAVAPLTKFVPLIVIDVPPTAGPLFGFTPVTVGAGPRYVYPFVKLPLCVSGLVTVTVTAPAACAAVVAVMVVLLTTTTFVAAVPPSVAVAPLTKFVPLIVIDVPPTAGPLFGFTPVTVGADPRYVYPFVKLPLCVSGLVTVTVTAPAACAAVVAVMVVLFPTTTFVAAVPPSVTVAPLTKFVPLIVIDVPPTAGPLFGLTLVTVGAVLPLVNVPPVKERILTVGPPNNASAIPGCPVAYWLSL